jgi:hypothetical protein
MRHELRPKNPSPACWAADRSSKGTASVNARALIQFRPQLAQTLFYDEVIILSPGVAGDPAPTLQILGVLPRIVRNPQRYYAPGALL